MNIIELLKTILNTVRVSHIKPLSATIFILSLSNFVNAADRYWVGVTTSWNDDFNWATSSGGFPPASVPGVGDVAIFDSGGGDCTINDPVNVAGFNVKSSYGGTISQGAFKITIGTSNAVFAGGIFNGGTENITIIGDLTISGIATSFTSTTQTLELQGDYTFSVLSTFAHNMGTVRTGGNGGTYTGSQVFYKWTIGPAPANENITTTIAAATTITVTNILTVDAVGALNYYINGGIIAAQGDIIFDSDLTSKNIGTATILINGGDTQNFTGYTTDAAYYGLPNITINNPGETLNLLNNIATSGNFTYTAGTVNAGASKVWFLMENQTITAAIAVGSNITLYDVVFNEATNGDGHITIEAATTVTVNGTLTINSGGTDDRCEINGGTIAAKGNIIHNSTLTRPNTFVDGKLLINGTGDQLFTGNANFIGAGEKIFYGLPDVEVAKTGGQLTFAGHINFPNDFIVTSGNVDGRFNSSFINYGGENTNFTSFENYPVFKARFSSGATGGGTTLGGITITVNSDLEFYSDVDQFYDINDGTISAKGDITIIGASTRYLKGTFLLSILGSADQTFTGATALSTHFLANVAINKTGGTLTLTNNISVTGNWIYNATAGTVNPSTSTVLFKPEANFTLDLDAQGPTISMAFNNIIIDDGTTELTGDLDINGDLTLYGTPDVFLDLNVADNHTVSLAGDLIDNGTADHILERMGKFIFDGTSDQTISCPDGKTAGAEVFWNMEINKTLGIVDLDFPVEITNSGDFISGIMTTEATTNTLTFKENATTNGGTGELNPSFVSGPVEREGVNAFTYPLGNLDGATAFYAPMKVVDIIGGNATTIFTAEYKLVNPPNSGDTDGNILHVSGREYWDLSIANTIPTSADVTLYYDYACDSDIQDVSGAPQDLFMGLYDGAQWNKQATSIGNSILGIGATACGGVGTGSISVDNLSIGAASNLVTFATEFARNPLPIELISFTAQPDGNTVKLMWSTASETNNAYFVIERISEDLTYYEIGRVEGSNNSTEILHYAFIDPSPITGINYYRLKQVDFDSSFEYSPVISIDFNNNNPWAALYPNPVKLDLDNKLYFKFNTPEIREMMQVKMISMMGAVVYSGGVSIENNRSYIELAPDTPKGTYVVIFNDGKNINRKKITIN